MQLKHKSQGILVFSDFKKKRYRFLYGGMTTTLLIISLIFLFPLLWLFFSGFKTPVELYQIPFTIFPKEISWDKVVSVWQGASLGRYYFNSLLVVVGAVICSIFFNGILAYALSVLKPKGGRIIYGLILGSMLIPVVTNMVPLLSNIAALGFLDHRLTDIFPYAPFIPLWLVFGANAYYLVLFKTYFDGIPSVLFEAAQIDGANQWQMFTKITLPLAKPIIAVVAIFTLNAAWSDFMLPYLILTSESVQTVMVKVYILNATMGTASGFGPDALLMVVVFAIIPAIILYLFFQKQITGVNAQSGIK